MTETNPTDLLPMRDVVSLTGINPVTLRAWERRHGLIQPHRTEGGHRLYTASDVQRIRDILRWTANGLPISKVGPLLNRQPVEQRQGDEQFADWRAALARATATYDVQALEALHGQLFTLLPKAVVFGQVLLPVWQELRGSDALGARSQWLFLDYFLRARLLLRLQLNQADAPRVLLVAGDEQPELVLLGTALVLSGEQQRIEALGGALPLEEVALVCAAAQPAALVVAMQGPLNAALAKRLRWLQMEIACPLALAGAGPVLSQAPLDGAPVCLLDTQGGDVAAVLNALLRGTLDV